MRQAETVLLIDDNAELRVTAAAMLEAAGYRVAAAADADEARAQLERLDGTVDLAVTDVNLPGTDGIALAAELRRQLPRLPIVFISSHLGDRLAGRLADGDVVFLAKPFGPGSLSEALDRARREVKRAPASRVERAPAGPQRRRGPTVWLAVAATTLLGLGLFVEIGRQRAPELPAEVPTGVLRSAIIEPLFPLGSLLRRPATLSWRAIAEADAYRVEIRRIGYDLIYRTTASRATVALPDEVQAALEPGVDYTWQVEALVGGRRLALSEPVRFRLRVAGIDQPE